MLTLEIDETEDLFFDMDGKEYVVESTALAYLTFNEILFPYFKDGNMCLAVMCNDVFAWASADAEAVESEEELINLTKESLKNKTWGGAIWAAKKRKCKPQRPVIDILKAYSLWDDEMESLPSNLYSE